MPVVIFSLRAPVLILTEHSFMDLYGEKRLKSESFRTALALFRPVKTVIVANDAGDDIVPHAITKVSSRPYCVLFPLRFARIAGIYREQKPKVPIVILEGRYPARNIPAINALLQTLENDIYLFGTDIEDEFFRIAMVAAILDDGQEGRIIIFIESVQNSFFGAQAREAFFRGIENITENPPVASFLTSFPQFFETSDVFCVVQVGVGTEYLEKKADIPVILFSWLDPSLAPLDVILVVDDSPWAQAFEAVSLVSAGIKEGKVRSKFIFINTENIDKGILRKIKKIE